MKLLPGQELKGFRVERARESKELGGVFYELRHIKTGAELDWLDNGCDNKLFCVGFKTLPEDSTGVFHILEHSVLCGSEKYPVKEPFVDLLKSSMNTFLNAMTFPDKTIYPVSSRNERDYLNLVSVYLDAVFAPRCVVDPNAFRQEGWHLELDDEGSPYINGVVYNEMKGATSGVDDILEEGMNAL
ncbi:MAG: insulinase family protein, partial [Clostridia bacterium]|nr:insulinase family protein [Clostridia bacterium]